MKITLTILFLCLLSYSQAQNTLPFNFGSNQTQIGKQNITDTSVEKIQGFVLLYTMAKDSLVVVYKKAEMTNYYQNGFKDYYSSLPADPDGSIPCVSVINHEIIKNLLKSEIRIKGVLLKTANYRFIPNSEIIE
jgi:hypothetical protein